MQFALPPRQASLVERVSLGCLALVFALTLYGVVENGLVALHAVALPEPALPAAILLVVAGAPLVLEGALLGTGSLSKGHRWRIALALVLFVGALVLEPHAFFPALPDAMQNPFVYEAISQLAILCLVGATCLALRSRLAWVGFAFVVAHSILAVPLNAVPFSGPRQPMLSIIATQIPLAVGLAVLVWLFAGEASKSRAA